MLAVEAVTDSASVVDTIHYPVGIVLHGRREYDYLIEFAQLCQEFVAEWPDHIKEIVLAVRQLLQVFLVIRILVVGANKMYQGLIEVKN